MGVYIEDMKLPTSCGYCAFCQAPAKQWKCSATRELIDARNFFQERPEWCPLKEVDLDDYKTCCICAKRSTCGVFDQGERIERGINDTPCDQFELEVTA